MTSVRTIPKLTSRSSSMASSDAGAENAGQPQPESYFVSDWNSSAPPPAHRRWRGSNVWSYSPLNGRSVPFSRRTRYCSGLSSARHSASVLLILFTLNSLATAAFVTPLWLLSDRPPMPSERPVEARGLVKRYGAITAVDHVDL